MSDMPERIWAWVYNLPHNKHHKTRCWVDFVPTFKPWVIVDWPGWRFWVKRRTEYTQVATEFIRADVAANMVATALREAARVALNACLVPPDGGSPTENEAAVCAAASRYILALIPRETAMTELARLGQELE